MSSRRQDPARVPDLVSAINILESSCLTLKYEQWLPSNKCKFTPNQPLSDLSYQDSVLMSISAASSQAPIILSTIPVAVSDMTPPWSGSQIAYELYGVQHITKR